MPICQDWIRLEPCTMSWDGHRTDKDIPRRSEKRIRVVVGHADERAEGKENVLSVGHRARRCQI